MGCARSQQVRQEQEYWGKGRGPKEQASADGPRLILVNRNSLQRCVFERASALRVDGGTARMTLASHPGYGLGLRHAELKSIFGWRYIETCIARNAGLTLRRSGEHLVYDAESCVLDVAWGDFRSHVTVNLVRGGSVGRTFGSGFPRRWAVNEDGTLSPANAAHLCLGVSQPRTVLVKQDSPRRLRLAAKPSVAAAPLRLRDTDLAIGFAEDVEERRYGEWRYRYSTVVDASQAPPACHRDANFLVTGDGALALDIAFWKFEEGNEVNWVGGHSDGKTLLKGGGRDWRVGADGYIINPKSNLALGTDCSLECYQELAGLQRPGVRPVAEELAALSGPEIVVSVQKLSGFNFPVRTKQDASGELLARQVAEHEGIRDHTDVRLIVHGFQEVSPDLSLMTQDITSSTVVALTLKNV
mmetsp:Transcript_33425/g.105583  ORF Transcript_33425/g.105583 Transcript_33425/m.105583 type:complete len:414 (-) Transcript_33425:85-1326(-)